MERIDADTRTVSAPVEVFAPALDATPAPSAVVARRSRLAARAPLALVAAALAFNLVELAPELTRVAYLNDSAMHSEMVREATALLRAGHLPWTSWFPYLGLGSPDFLHYQSLGATITGALGLVIGPNRAFVLSLYLLLATWPLSIYAAGRLFRLSRWQAACAAACSPFVVSVLGIGYEQITYLFIGFGMWSQLWAMWMLPLAWGFSYRAVREGRYAGLAAFFIMVTAALHYMTGYLAFAVVPLFALASWRGLGRHLARAGIVLAGAGLATAWVVVPLLHYRPWASINQFLENGPDVNSYGAPAALRWLVSGQLLDAHRLAVLTVLAAVGVLAAAWHWRQDTGRCLVLALVASLVLFFGKPTLGSLENLLPGHADLFMRRFLMGVQLAAIFLAGIGLAGLGALVRRAAALLVRPARPAAWQGAAAVIACVGVAAVLTPAWRAVARSDASNASYIANQKLADRSDGADLRALLALTRRLGGGRIYAGTPANWGLNFTIGAVPVFRYLANLDVDEVGFTLRTASLMTNPEVEFDQSVPGDYAAFGVRFLLLPTSMSPPIPATLVARRGPFALWQHGTQRYVSVVDTISPPITANRGDLGTQSVNFLDSALPGAGRFPTVAYDGAPAAAPTLAVGANPAGPAGSVLAETDRPGAGAFSATVRATRTAVVLLSASYDPGWRATVDGRSAPTEMIAPALVGVRVTAGEHRVAFTYHAESHYPALAVAGLAGLAVAAGGVRLLDRLVPERAASGARTGEGDTSAGVSVATPGEDGDTVTTETETESEADGDRAGPDGAGG